MIVKVTASDLGGFVAAPASKSSMQRAVAAALLANGTSILSNPSYCDDSAAAMRIAECLGAVIEKSEDKVLISGGFHPVCDMLDCGESGLGVRMFSAIGSLADKKLTFTGSGSILSRPMEMLQKTLYELGVQVTTSDGRLPLKVRGPLKGGKAVVDGSVSSQFLTGLLFALPLTDTDSELEIISLKSKPYIDLTMDVLLKFGISIGNKDYKTMHIPGRQKYKAANYNVEGDWSGAAFLAVTGAISGKITIGKLQLTSKQADRKILEVLAIAGAIISENNDSITIEPNQLKPFSYDISDCPDLAPPLVTLASFCPGKSIITGTKRLALKESDRASTLKHEFSSIGVDIKIQDDQLEIRSDGKVKGGNVFSHGDHRIAMALVTAGTKSESPVIIHDAEAINKSYPDFFKDLSGLGADIKIINE